MTTRNQREHCCWTNNSLIFSRNLYHFTETPLTSSWIVWGRKSTYIQRKCSVWNPKWTNWRQKSFRLTVIYSSEISWRRTRRSFSVRTTSTTRKSRYTDCIIVKVNSCLCLLFFWKYSVKHADRMTIEFSIHIWNIYMYKHLFLYEHYI